MDIANLSMVLKPWKWTTVLSRITERRRGPRAELEINKGQHSVKKAALINSCLFVWFWLNQKQGHWLRIRTEDLG